MSSRFKCWPGERTRCKKEATAEGDPPLSSDQLEFLPRHHLKVLRDQLCSKGKAKKSKLLPCRKH